MEIEHPTADPLAVELGPPPDTLNNGDRLTQKEFHALYKRTPKHFRAELIGGIVYVASPLRARHSDGQSLLATLATLYRARTPGTHAGDNATVILGKKSEPQPDILVRVLEDHGGRSRVNARGYVQGPPEFVIEVSDSSRTIDLNAKRKVYARHGVLEYLVFNLKDQRLHGFDLAGRKVRPADADGVYRSVSFPGLWINVGAVFADDVTAVLATLDAGLATPEHAAFVARLAAAKTP
jgi:Uma2 family endonuclease